ncbi:MAG: Glutathione S-transferase [Candidatus Kaiserbacteria bacterium]|nr:Glutathione S-transferase [Candidatus Kaiserbacteria bacterium]
MLKLYTWKTPNGYKVPIMLEELALPYEVIPVNISKDQQKTPEFLAMNPNHKIPVLVDEDAEGGALTIFESGAILIYLAEKYGKYLPTDTAARSTTIEWLMFQMASVGPMFGQANHFIKYAPERIEYPTKRYSDESNRLMGVMNTRLSAVEYLAGEYSIADIATWPWIKAGISTGFIKLEEYPSVEKWYKAIGSRPATLRALENVDKAAKDGPAVCMPKFD